MIEHPKDEATAVGRPLDPPIEASRRKLLGAIADAADVTFLRLWGNIGDELIYAGARQLLSGVQFKERSIFDLGRLHGHTALFAGGGGWCGAYRHAPPLLEAAAERFERVIVLPSSFDVSITPVRDVLARTKALVFARERVSFEQIRGLCAADLAHDTAFFFDYGPYRQCAADGTLTALRTDPEARPRGVPRGNNDISATCESLDEWLWTIARHRRVVTDRAHVIIASALLGKEVAYGVSNYHKVGAIVDFAFDGYPVRPLHEDEMREAAPAHDDGPAPTPVDWQWRMSLLRTWEELLGVIPERATFLLADQGALGGPPLPARRAVPFPETDGEFGGPPANDEDAVREFERLQSNASFMVFAEPAFWYFDHYPAFTNRLRLRYPVALENDRLVVFDLRAAKPARANVHQRSEP